MKDEDRTKEALMHELAQLRRRASALEAAAVKRQGADEVLQKSEQDYRDLYENAPNAYFSIGAADASVIKCNAAALSLLGYDRESITGMKVLDLYADTSHGVSKAKKILKHFQTGESIRDVEMQMKHRNGHPIWTSLSIEPVLDRDGNILESRSMVIDISERKATEEVLQRKTHELDQRVKALNCFYGISHLREEKGISLEEIFQETVDLIPPSWQYPEIACARIILQDQEFKTENYRETVWKQASDIVAHGKRIGSLEVYYLAEKPEMDEGPFSKEERNLLNAIVERLGRITEHKWAEEALRESEEKYRSMMEAMTDPVYICSPDLRVSYMNPPMLQRVGRDATGEPCHKAVHELDENCPWCVYGKVQKGENAYTEVVSPKDGRSYHISHAPIFHVNGSVSKMTIFRDITEQKRAEEVLRSARNNLEKRVRERTAELQLLSSRLLDVQEDERKRIAGDLHDGIGQSLSAIKFGVETALARLKDETALSAVDTLTPLVPMLQDAIEDVRKTVMNVRPSILDDLGILATISWFFRQFQAVYSDIRVEKEIGVQEKDVPDALKTNIFRVLQEAANNIAKHSQADRMRVSLRKTGNVLELVIEDNGGGLDLQSVLATAGVETGFGITSMKERTERSGGSFSIKSKTGTGTTVRAVWPSRSEKPIS